jgi:hypothetical protein
MTTCAAVVTRSFRVGSRTATLTIEAPRKGEVVNMVAKWDPSPPGRPPTDVELRQYREDRNAALAELADLIGERIAVAEL